MAKMSVDAAKDRSVQWARQFWITGPVFREHICRVECEDVEFSRARWRSRRREILRRCEPTLSDDKNVEDHLDPSSVDPWSVDGRTLREETLHLVRCEACRGQKRVACSTCDEEGWVACTECGSTGRVISPKTGRPINCKRCRGTGNRRCVCRGRPVRCGGCEGKGRVDEWLDLHESDRIALVSTGDERLREGITDADDPASFGHQYGDLKPRETWIGSDVSSAPMHTRSLLRGALAVDLDPRHDRLQDVAFEHYRESVATVDYSLAGRTAAVDVMGWNLTVVENPTSRTPFRVRFGAVAGLALCAGGAAFIAALAYGYRHPFFRASPIYDYLLINAVVLVIAFGVLASTAITHGLRARLSMTALALALVSTAIEGRLLTGGKPTVSNAAALVEDGQVDQALFELESAWTLNKNVNAARFHDRLVLDQIQADDHDLESVWRGIESRFLTDAGRKHAVSYATQRVLSEVATSRESGDDSRISLLIETVPNAYRQQESIRPVFEAEYFRQLNECLEPPKPGCVSRVRDALVNLGDQDMVQRSDRLVLEASQRVLTATERKIQANAALESRLAACAGRHPALELMRLVDNSAAAATSDRLDVVCQQIGAQKIEADRLAAELARRRAEDRYGAAVAAWQRAPLRCNDGSLSPSCVCGQRSKRGCCSHHRGVDSCSRAYPRRDDYQ